MQTLTRCSRRAALASGWLAWSRLASAQGPRSQPPQRAVPPAKKLALVATAYHYLSHAYHLGGRFLHGYLRGETHHFPEFGIAGAYVAQRKDNDLSAELARTHRFGLYSTIAEALTLGGDQLAVDGVLLIGEHGDYSYNAKGQKLYPRYELFQEMVAVFNKSKRTVPVFCDKHLYWDRAKATEMAATARRLGIPLYAGSSLPVTWRRPELELPAGTPIHEALVVSRGEIEIFGIHALEALQCMVERRAKEEQGIRAVTCLEGEAVWKAADAGVWSWELLEHALRYSPSRNAGDVKTNCRHFVPPPGRPTFPRGPVAFVLEYRDGLRATALLLNGHVDDTTFAARIGAEKKLVGTLFYLPPPPGAAFLEALAIHVEEFMKTGRPPYPVERTLLTGNTLDLVLESRLRGHTRLETPELAVRYAAPADSGFLRGKPYGER